MYDITVEIKAMALVVLPNLSALQLLGGYYVPLNDSTENIQCQLMYDNLMYSIVFFCIYHWFRLIRRISLIQLELLKHD